MVSQETVVHFGAVYLAVVVLLVAGALDIGDGTGPAATAVLVLFYAIFFGGGHLYLAIRGDDGMVPSDARWRYLAMLGAVLSGGVLVLYAGDRTIGTITLEAVSAAFFVLIVGGYLLTETIVAYREHRPE
ncbi:hypothetical protein [Natrinema halophilum]|uniref:Uncharacterized protein n=1 Tax=Natrinema halophilum TaxID=1699371 RepID=A0A7D5GJV2_9EURY|nr:hypothetical protein [Natrinema halophilum]QLG50887.1 hypothetical protein HYG82_19625 [Natrinema halophilum]